MSSMVALFSHYRTNMERAVGLRPDTRSEVAVRVPRAQGRFLSLTGFALRGLKVRDASLQHFEPGIQGGRFGLERGPARRGNSGGTEPPATEKTAPASAKVGAAAETQLPAPAACPSTGAATHAAAVEIRCGRPSGTCAETASGCGSFAHRSCSIRSWHDVDLLSLLVLRGRRPRGGLLIGTHALSAVPASASASHPGVVPVRAAGGAVIRHFIMAALDADGPAVGQGPGDRAPGL